MLTWSTASRKWMYQLTVNGTLIESAWTRGDKGKDQSKRAQQNKAKIKGNEETTGLLETNGDEVANVCTRVELLGLPEDTSAVHSNQPSGSCDHADAHIVEFIRSLPPPGSMEQDKASQSSHWAQGLRYFGYDDEKKEGQGDIFYVECTGVPVFGRGDIFQTPKEPLVKNFPTDQQAQKMSQRIQQSQQVFKNSAQEPAECNRMQQTIGNFVRNVAKGYHCNFFNENTGSRRRAKFFLDKTLEHLIVVPIVEAQGPGTQGFVVYLKVGVSSITDILTYADDGRRRFPDSVLQALTEGEHDSLLTIQHRCKTKGDLRLHLLVRSDEARKSLLNCLRILCVVKLSDAFLESLGLKEAKQEVPMEFFNPEVVDEDTGAMAVASVMFVRRPIGIKFKREPTSMALVVSGVSPGSHAHELGVRVNWRIKSIGGYEMNEVPLQEANRLIKTHVLKLPDRPALALGGAADKESITAGSISTLMAKVYKYD